MSQKGVGLESADSILLYACRREIMVVDTYTARLLARKCDMEGLEYEEIREWLSLVYMDVRARRANLSAAIS